MAETVAVLGAGMAGLCAALALAGGDRQIVLLDRDPPPPEGGVEAAFDDWARRGVGQLRHSHAFLARLRSLLRREHPALLEALRASGARELTFEQGLPETARAAYRPTPADEELVVLVSRRTTLEVIMRHHVEALPGVTLRPSTFVTGLISERDSAGSLVARGLALEGGASLAADIVVDAAGRFSPVAEWLALTGAAPDEEAESCAILYYTRFYRLRDGQAEPPRGRISGTGDLGYLKFAVFPADNGTFSITLAVPEVEEAMRAAVLRPEAFDAICATLPGIAAWTDPQRATPVSRVMGMGALESRWRDMAPGRRPAALGLFSVGDSLVRTNPLFGRGCCFAAVEAHLLRDVLAETTDPVVRAQLYCERVRVELRPFYDDMARQDRSAARRALEGLDPAFRPRWRARLMRAFLQDGVAIAVRRDVDLLRQASRAFHMLDPPARWLGRPGTMLKVMAAWARGRRANARFYAEKPGPPRSAMFEALGLPPLADLERVRAADAAVVR